MATDTPFISTTDLSDYIGRDVTADPGALMAIDAACNIVRTRSGQTFNASTETTFFDGTGTDCLIFPQVPVLAAGTVVAAGVPLVQGTDYVLAGDRRLIRTAGTAYSTLSGGFSPHWPLGRQNIMVTYDHGYATVPSDVRMVALQVASRITIQGIAESENVSMESVTYSTPALDLTAGENIILLRHRAY